MTLIPSSNSIDSVVPKTSPTALALTGLAALGVVFGHGLIPGLEGFLAYDGSSKRDDMAGVYIQRCPSCRNSC